MSTAIRKRGGTRRRLLGAVAVVVALIWVFPIYWMISSSFLPTNRLRTPEPTFFPLSGTLSNFRRVLTDPSFFDAFRVSLAVTGITVVGAILFAFLAALAISRFRFRGRKSFLITILVVQMIPAEGPLTSTCLASALQLHRRAGVLVDETAGARLRLADCCRHTYALKPDWQRP